MASFKRVCIEPDPLSKWEQVTSWCNLPSKKNYQSGWHAGLKSSFTELIKPPNILSFIIASKECQVGHLHLRSQKKCLYSVSISHLLKKQNYRESARVSRKLTDQTNTSHPLKSGNLRPWKSFLDAAKYWGTVQCIYNSHKDYFVLTDKVSFILLMSPNIA